MARHAEQERLKTERDAERAQKEQERKEAKERLRLENLEK